MTVWPSAGARATNCAAIMPLAPALLSTITVVFVCSPTDWAKARASWSVALPAAKGTTRVMGLLGKVWAAAGPARQAAAANARVLRASRREIRFMGLSPRGR